MAKGGKRRGAGRKVGSKSQTTLARASLKAYFDAEARTHFAPVLKQYFRLALGQASDADPRIVIDLLNRQLGKPPESVQLAGADGAVLAVRIIDEHHDT